MKIKLNQKFPGHDMLMKNLILEFPELTIKVKERKWGLEKPSFKYKKNLYEFDRIDELMDQVKKIIRLKDDQYGHKIKNQVKDVDPEEETFKEKQVLVKAEK